MFSTRRLSGCAGAELLCLSITDRTLESCLTWGCKSGAGCHRGSAHVTERGVHVSLFKCKADRLTFSFSSIRLKPLDFSSATAVRLKSLNFSSACAVRLKLLALSCAIAFRARLCRIMSCLPSMMGYGKCFTTFSWVINTLFTLPYVNVRWTWSLRVLNSQPPKAPQIFVTCGVKKSDRVLASLRANSS